jgi:hypothetical protein
VGRRPSTSALYLFMRKLFWLIGFVLTTFLVGEQARAASVCANPLNVVVNCGFETGNLSGWTLLGDTNGGGVDAFDAHSGNFGAFLAGFGSPAAGNTNYSDLRQILTTNIGQVYSLRYYTAYVPSATVRPDNTFFAEIGGNKIASSVQSNVASAPWTLDGSFLFTATSSQTQLDFFAEDANFFFSLDDVSVTPLPEPASLLLMLAGFAGLYALRRCQSLSECARDVE